MVKKMYLESYTDTEIALYIHINSYLKEPILFKTFSIKAGEKLDFEFHEGFNAHWAQLKTN
jgi:hypothetical protein